MDGPSVRDSTTLPQRRICTMTERNGWNSFRVETLEGRHGDAFTQALVVLVTSLIEPDTSSICGRADVEAFFEPEYLFPNERMLIMHFVYHAAGGAGLSPSEPRLDIPREAWKAFLLPILSDAHRLTAFWHGTTPAAKIKPVLERLGFAAHIEEIYSLQHRLGPLLGSTSFVPFKAPLLMGMSEVSEVFAKASGLQKLIGDVSIPKDFLTILTLSHFDDSRQLFLQEWSGTYDAERTSAMAIQQFWSASTPRIAMSLLAALLVRPYYAIGNLSIHHEPPQLSEELSPKTYFLLVEAATSFAAQFSLEPLLHNLFPRSRYLRVQFSGLRLQQWADYWQTRRLGLDSRAFRVGSCDDERSALDGYSPTSISGNDRRPMQVPATLIHWFRMCAGNRSQKRTQR